MKKFLTLLVACLMLVSAFSMNVFAADGTTVHAVGDASAGTGVAPDSFTSEAVPSGTEGDINITVGTVVHRYAADVEFPAMTIDLGGVTWDVQNRKYVATSAATDKIAKTFSITVSNHSDLGINAAGKIDTQSQNSKLAQAGLTATVTTTTPVGAVIPVAGGSGKIVTGTLTVSVTPGTSWKDSLEKIVAIDGTAPEGDLLLAKVVVTVTPAA